MNCIIIQSIAVNPGSVWLSNQSGVKLVVACCGGNNFLGRFLDFLTSMPIYRVRISSWIFELDFRVRFSSYDFELYFRVRILSQDSS